jgi:pilus assembly protein CpaE
VQSVIVATMAPSAESSAALRAHLRKTGLATIAEDVTEYCRARSDWQTRRFLEARPDVILIDAEHLDAALISIQVLHTAIPSASILVCTNARDTDTILKIVRAGARELLSMPLTTESLSEALQRHIEERQRQQKNEAVATARLYTICSGKQGSGATTIAINLAASLAEDDDARVALIDLDWPVGDIAAFLNIKPAFNVADALSSLSRLDPVLLDSYMQKHDRVYVLSGLEEFTANEGFDTAAVVELLEIVTQSFTHVVVDLPLTVPRQLFQMATQMSSAIVTVVTPDLLSLRKTERLLSLFNRLNVSDKVRLVLNRADRSNQITDNDIKKVLRQPVTLKVANDYPACVQAIHAGKSVLATSKNTIVRTYRELARQLTGQSPQNEKGMFTLLPSTLVPRTSLRS